EAVNLIRRHVVVALTLSVFALGKVSFGQIKVGPNVNIVANEQYLNKQLEVDAPGGNPLNPNHMFAGYIDYQTEFESSTERVSARARCGYSFSTNGGKTWKN